MRIAFLFLVSVCVAHAGELTFTGNVVRIVDGDTITVLTSSKESVKVRLHGIDAPESKQAFGSRSKQQLSALVFGKVVRVEVIQKDRYGRTVGRVFCEDVGVNAEMVRRGFAWWYREYAKRDLNLGAAELEAKKAGRGLWQDESPIPPWEFRRSGMKTKLNAAAP